MPPPFSRHVLGMIRCSVIGRSAPRKDVGFVELVDQAHRDEQHSASHAKVVVGEVVDVGKLDENLVRVLDLNLRIEEEPVVESVPGIQNGPKEIELARASRRLSRLVLIREVLIEHLAVARDRNARVPLIGRGG